LKSYIFVDVPIWGDFMALTEAQMWVQYQWILVSCCVLMYIILPVIQKKPLKKKGINALNGIPIKITDFTIFDSRFS